MDMQNNARNDTDILPLMAEGLLQLAGLQSIPCFRSLKAVSMEFLERYSSNTFEGENGRLLMSVKKSFPSGDHVLHSYVDSRFSIDTFQRELIRQMRVDETVAVTVLLAMPPPYSKANLISSISS